MGKHDKYPYLAFFKDQRKIILYMFVCIQHINGLKTYLSLRTFFILKKMKIMPKCIFIPVSYGLFYFLIILWLFENAWWPVKSIGSIFYKQTLMLICLFSIVVSRFKSRLALSMMFFGWPTFSNNMLQARDPVK